jgi:putative lipoprotein
MHARPLLLIAAIALSACNSDKLPSTEAVPAPAEPLIPATAQASPWEQARARGISFRGVGNEPGWLVEVGAGETPALHADLDYGERKIDVARAQPLPGATGYEGTASDGAEVKLQLQREECNDGMSDQSYPISAKLSVDGKTYAGCGRFLQE